MYVYLCSCHVAKENIYSIMEKIFSFVPVYGYGDGVFICRYRRNCTDEIASLKAFLSVFNHFLCVMKYSSHNIFLTIYPKWNGVWNWWLPWLPSKIYNLSSFPVLVTSRNGMSYKDTMYFIYAYIKQSGLLKAFLFVEIIVK